MKSFVLFLALIAFTAAQPVRKSKAEAERIRTACFKRFNVPEEVMERSWRSDVPSIEAFEVGLCLLRDMDVWSDSTGFNIDNIMIQMMPEHFPHKQKLDDSLKNCLNAKREGETPLNWAYRNFKCFDILLEANGSTRRVKH